MNKQSALVSYKTLNALVALAACSMIGTWFLMALMKHTYENWLINEVLNSTLATLSVWNIFQALTESLMQWHLAPLLLIETLLVSGFKQGNFLEIGLWFIATVLQILAALLGARLAYIKNRSVPNWAVFNFFATYICPFILVRLSSRKTFAAYPYRQIEENDF